MKQNKYLTLNVNEFYRQKRKAPFYKQFLVKGEIKWDGDPNKLIEFFDKFRFDLQGGLLAKGEQDEETKKIYKKNRFYVGEFWYLTKTGDMPYPIWPIGFDDDNPYIKEGDLITLLYTTSKSLWKRYYVLINHKTLAKRLEKSRKIYG